MRRAERSASMVRTQFVVEQRVGEEWRPIADAFEAPNAERAVARAARGHGHRRARPLDPPGQPYEFFWLPPWGLPERIAQ